MQQQQRQKHMIRRRVPAATLIQCLWRCYAVSEGHNSFATWRVHMIPSKSPPVFKNNTSFVHRLSIRRTRHSIRSPVIEHLRSRIKLESTNEMTGIDEMALSRKNSDAAYSRYLNQSCSHAASNSFEWIIPSIKLNSCAVELVGTFLSSSNSKSKTGLCNICILN